MPTFSLGRLGRFQISRLSPLHTSSPTEHQNLPSSPPPEYAGIAEIETKYHAPSQARPPKSKTEQMRRFLIEILALTFNANMDELNAALYNIPTPSGTNTVLCDSERVYLLAQSNLVRKVNGHFVCNEKTRIDRRDEDRLYETIIRPAENLDGDRTLPHFSLDMIAWYGEEVRSPSGTRWASTIPGYWERGPLWVPRGELLNILKCMSSFLNVIKYVAPNDEAHSVLWEAWDDSRRRCGYGQLDPSLFCWPMREEYYHVGNSLQEMMPSEPWVVVSES